MARSRMIRPEFFNDPAFSRISVGARLTYLALLPHMDRNGVMIGNPHTVRSMVYPFDSKMRVNDVRRWLDELSLIGRIILFTHNGTKYMLDPVFTAHQRIYSNDPDIYCVPVGILHELISDFESKKRQLCFDPLILNQNLNLNLKDAGKSENVDNSANGAEISNFQKNAFEGGHGAARNIVVDGKDEYLRRFLEQERQKQGLTKNGQETQNIHSDH